MTKIIFTNTSICGWNKGSAAQVISTIKILKHFIPNASFTLISRRPNDINQATKYRLKVVNYFSKNSRTMELLFLYHHVADLFRCEIAIMLRKIGLKVNSLLNEKYLKEYAGADLIVDLSGDSFSDSKGGNSPINSLGILIGVLFKKPIIFFSQSIGPFKRWTMPLTKFCLNKANLIIVREEITKNYLEEMGVKSPIHLTADCAFVLEPAPYESIEKILLKENIYPNKKPFIGISANAMLDDKENNYVNSMAQLIDYVIEKVNAQVVFVPHVVGINGRGDDRVMGEKIYNLTKNKENINLIKGDYSPEELKGIIGLCDIFVGGRMHANIAAISSCVPTIATAWSHKYYGIMRTVGQEKYVCDFKTMTFEELKSKVDDLWENKEKIQEELKVKVEDQKELAWYSGKLVRDLLNRKK